MPPIQVPYFDNREIDLTDEDGHLHRSEGARAALNSFLKLTSADRLADTRHVFAYYSDVCDVVGSDFLEEVMGPLPTDPADIWNHVRPRSIFVWDDYMVPDVWYVVLDANCSWEDEHGLMMVWRNGERLTRVSDYDGHASNTHANTTDPEMANLVYASSDPRYVTRLDP
jgi:hypothetical protein